RACPNALSGFAPGVLPGAGVYRRQFSLVQSGDAVDGNRVLGRDGHGRLATGTNRDGRTGARVVPEVAVDYVAVGAGGQPGGEGVGLGGGVIVDGDPAPLATAERDEVDGVVVP